MDLHQVIIQTVGMLERTIPKMIRIESELESEPALIDGDPVQLEQILMNLGTNARDAMPDGGRLLFQTETVILDETFCRTRADLNPGAHVLLKVSDTGHGIPTDRLEHIFEPFFTTKGVGVGTGLGLSMVYGIVRGHRGHVSCYSEPGRGTVFQLYFPRWAGTLAEGRPAAAPLAQIQGGTETILLVDDEPVILELGKEMLTDHGYQIRTAASGEAALDVLATPGLKVDLVILDLGMPGMGGFKCLTRIMNGDPSRKVIISSGYLAQPLIGDCETAGARGFIGKPYRITDLLARVRAVLDENPPTPPPSLSV
jgi:CheY-like chemotaxis protein